MSSETKTIFVSSLVASTIPTGILYPFDRAFSLSIRSKLPYFSWGNFKHPFAQIHQSIIQRSLLSSVYFFMQGELKANLAPYLKNEWKFNELTIKLTVGGIAGFLNAISTNAITAIRNYTYQDPGRKFFQSANEMWKLGGIRAFTNGTRACIYRDITFGSVYEVFRSMLLVEFKKSTALMNLSESNEKKKILMLEFFSNFLASGLAAITSGSFNYARITQFNTPFGQKQLSIQTILSQLWKESHQNSKSVWGRLNFFQSKLNVGPGTVLVMAKMGFGQLLFNYTNNKLAESNKENEQRKLKR